MREFSDIINYSEMVDLLCWEQSTFYTITRTPLPWLEQLHWISVRIRTRLDVLCWDLGRLLFANRPFI